MDLNEYIYIYIYIYVYIYIYIYIYIAPTKNEDQDPRMYSLFYRYGTDSHLRILAIMPLLIK